MKVFIIEPKEDSILSDCHVVAANDVREALVFMNSLESRMGGHDWLKSKPNVWNLAGAEYESKTPCVINCDLHIDASEMLKPKYKSKVTGNVLPPPGKRGRKPNPNKL